MALGDSAPAGEMAACRLLPTSAGVTAAALPETGAELDLLVVPGAERRGFEVNYSDAPALTPSMRAAVTDLRLDALEVLYPGARTYSLHEKVRVVPLGRLSTDIRP